MYQIILRYQGQYKSLSHGQSVSTVKYDTQGTSRSYRKIPVTACQLEDDVDAAANGVFERMYGLVAKAILLETVKRGTERVDTVKEQVYQGALTLIKANAQGAAAHSSEVTVLPLSPSQSLVMPSAV